MLGEYGIENSIMRENKRQIQLNAYLREKKLYGFFELKVAKGNTFNFNDMEQNQYEGLQATVNEGLVWKFSDADPRKKPCDTISVPPLPSYVVIAFDNTMYFIRIEEIVKMRNDGYKSISFGECQMLSERLLRV